MIRDPRSSPTTPSYASYAPHSPYLRRVSPPGSPAPKKCCFDHREPTRETFFCCCYTCSGDRTTSILATLGVCCLVLAYTILGAFVFMTLEGGIHHDTAVAASKLDPKSDGGIGTLRAETVDRLWSITENLNILYRENWTRLAAEEVMLFQEALFKSLRHSNGHMTTGTAYYQHVHKWSFSSSFLYSLTLITTIATLNAISDGMQYGWTAPVLPLLRNNETSSLKITKNDEMWLESVYLIAGLVGIPITAYLVDKIGRKKSIVIASLTTMLSWGIIAIARSVEYLYVARCLSGAAADMAFVATPMYIAEISNEKWRGFLVGFDYLMMLLGVLMIYSIAPFTPYYVPSIVGACLTLLQLAALPFMPPSPYYLLSKGEEEQAKKSLNRLRRRGSGNQEELEGMIQAVQRQNEETGRIQDLILVKSNRRAVIIITVLVACQHFSGYSVMVMNVHTILIEADSTYISSEFTGIISSALMLIAAAVCSLCVDKVGRKILLVISSVLTSSCLLALAVYFRLKSSGTDVKSYSWIPVVAVMGFAVMFKLGLGYLPQLIVSELFPSNVKALGMTFGDAIFIIFGAVSVIFYQYLVILCGIDVPFFVFAIVAFASAIFTVCVVPETKGKTLEEIQEMLKGGTVEKNRPT